MEEYIVIGLQLKTQSECSLKIEADEGETTDNILLSIQIDGEYISASDYEYFSAFQKLRDKLLKLGYALKCCGSCLNAVQSNMMCATHKIYLVNLGEQALKKNIVSIYDYTNIESFPDTQAQTIFIEKWISSL